ncbi:MAG: zf-HC2 domain-containing protein [Nocardioidaceae bacterium]|nr:zf-HC2 domain-containing protein [Nocardioidaceae bacterium]
MILKLHGHIGSHASALVDGQLSAAEEERAWKHVLGCPGCRRLVEREGWIKQRLAGLNGPSPLSPSPGLVGALYDVDAWAAVDEIERRSRRRRATAALVGAGSVGVAVVAMMAVTSPPAGRGEAPGRPVVPASIPTSVTSPAATGTARDQAGNGATADVDIAAFGR